MASAIDGKIESIKAAYKDVLGDRPSRMFMTKVERTLDEACHSTDTLREACRKTEGMVRIFLDVELSRSIGQRWREILGETG